MSLSRRRAAAERTLSAKTKARAPVARSFHMTGTPPPSIWDEYQNKGVTGIDRPMNIILKDLVRFLPGQTT